jgi:hypothetical protein
LPDHYQRRCPKVQQATKGKSTQTSQPQTKAQVGKTSSGSAWHKIGKEAESKSKIKEKQIQRMLTNGNSHDQNLVILSLVCKGVDLSSTSPLVNNGFLSRVTGGSIPRNVKKLIRVQKSEPFPPGGRPAR